MNRLTCLVASAACLLGVAALAQQSTPEPQRWTLDQSIDTALQHNRELRAVLQDDLKARAAVKEAQSSLRPTVGAQATYTRLAKEPTTSFGGQTIKLGDADDYGASATLTQPIDITGLIRNGIQMARLGSDVTREKVRMIRNNVNLQVREAFYNILRAEEGLKVATEAVANAEQRLKTARALVDAGSSPKLDIARAEAAVAAAEQMRISAENGVQMAKSAFNLVLGRDINEPVDIVPDAEAAALDGGYDGWLSTAVARRPEIRMAALGIELSDRSLFAARRALLPTLGVSVNSQFNLKKSTFNNESVVLSATAVMSVPIWDSGQTQARVEQARHDRESALISQEDARQGIALELKQATLLATEAQQKVTAATKGLEQATEALRVSRVRYEEGVTNQIELSDAELAYTQAQQNLVSARFDLRVANARILKAIGEFADPR